MNKAQAKTVSQLFATIAEACEALSATFSSVGGDSADSAGYGKAAKPVRGAKPAPTAAPAQSKAKKDEAVELTTDDVRDALRELVELRGKEVMVQALESVGAGKLVDVDESQYQELLDKINELKESEPDEAPEPVKGKGKPAAKKAKGPSLDDVTEAAKALIEADKPAYVKLTKKLGKPSEMEEDGYAAAIAAYEEAMPAADDADDDLL
jgi:hypothetical protein